MNADDNDAQEFGEITIDGYAPVQGSEQSASPRHLVTRKGKFRAPTQTAEGVYTPFALSPPSLDDDADGNPPDEHDTGQG